MRKASLAQPPLFALAERDGPRVTLRADTGAVAHLFVLEEDVVRVLLLADGALTSPPSWAVAPGQTDIAEPGRDRLDVSGFAAPAFTLEAGGEVLVLATARLRLEITLAGFLCRWSQATPEGWRLIAEDRPTQAYNFGWWDEGVYHYVKRRPGERYYGLGERAGAMDRAGRRFRLTNLDPMGYDASADDPLYKSIPYVLVVDAEGAAHGVFYDTTADPVFDFGHEHDNYHPHYRYMRAASGDLDYYMIAGPDAREVTRRYTWLTGRPALMPRWAVGYSGSTMTYTDAPNAQARMGEFIAGVSRHDIPCESFHLSSGYTSIGDRRYVFHWNREKFPDVAGFVRGYAEAGVELVPNIKPALLVTHPRYAELADKGWFVSDADGDPIVCQFWDEVGSYVDFTNPDAAAWWRGQVTEQLLAYGIRSTWNDNNEYEIWDSRARIAGFGTPRAAAAERPVQTLLMMRASRAAQIAHRPDERPYVVTRSGMAGMQRYAQTWSGDNYTAWKTLRFNQKMGLGMALSGVSNTGHDIGGFAGPAPEPELLLRWVQAGIVMPRFSIHSWNTDGTVNEPWMYPEVTPAIVGMMKLRRALRPLLHDLLWRHHADYEPVTRPLWLDFPEDPRAWQDGDAYLLGPDLLVAPALDQGVETVRAYLPAGATWRDLRDDKVYAGGAEHDLAAPLDGLPPMLAKEGSGVFVDLAPAGFAAAPPEPAVLLYPPVAGAMAWSGFDEADAAPGDPAALQGWRVTVEASEKSLAITAAWRGNAPAPAEALKLVLPAAETRAVTLNGEAVAMRVETVLGVSRRLATWRV
ncbi:alpha-glucosidase [Caulobacter segnis]|uniref:Glycoside hydrolase family 31 n=2 Tax=Caulobacter segnis TaxID=88688 RepID=D5VMK3_CAUST|nr:TIM-barrel domain-containing protein [Caulobacter segnis]ADG11726.1 glycoside hydrolase family 31 [Caulobacter segnis ATCC 21756]AVQ03367.1 alpha-glucosidase [Caulobacter segnis]